MLDTQQIKANMEVVDTNGQHVGTVDHLQGDIVELTREGFTDGLRHFVAIAAVKGLQGDKLLVEAGEATTVEAVAAAIDYARAHRTTSSLGVGLFGTSGHGTGSGGSGIGD